MKANLLNSELEKLPVFRSHKSRTTKKIHTINKKWLQLMFVTCQTDLVRGPPLPAVIYIKPPETPKEDNEDS